MRKSNGIRGILIITVSLLLFFTNIVYVNADEVVQTKVSQYAMTWEGNTNIPYVYGSKAAGRRGRSCANLEEVEEKNKSGGTVYGVDCSAFVSFVYKHCGLSITPQSGSILSEAKQKFTKEEDAIPGDVVYWEGHVGVYVGEGKFVHTNTSSPPTNFPHLSEFESYGYPKYFLRMVNDASELGVLSSNDASNLNKTVTETEGYGSLATESDLTGLVIENMLGDNRQDVELPNGEDLSTKEKENLASIKEYIDTKKEANGVKRWYHVGQSFIGIICIFYGVVFLLAYIFDYINVFVDFSLLGIISLGKFRILDKDYNGVDLNKHAGWSEEHKVTYLTISMVLVRAVVLIIIGLFLVSGLLSDILLLAYMWLRDLFS